MKVLVGCIVVTKYNNRSYKVDDIDFNENPASTFTRKDGSRISYEEYFRSRYKTAIRDVKQPMLVSNPTKVRRRLLYSGL